MSSKKAWAFLEDILAHPDDDTPRLIYADWLDDEGDSARAEFIRVQVERAHLPAWDARQVRLRLRERKLIEQQGRMWKRELPTIKGITWEEFRRGFIATADFSNYAVFKTNASACWAATPIEAVSVGWPRESDTIERIAPIAGLRELSITSTLVERLAVDWLAHAPLLSTLRALNLHHCSMGAEGFQRLCSSPHLNNLRALRAPGNYIGNNAIDALFKSASLSSLAELDLSEERGYGRYGEDPILEAVGLESLAGWPGLARLRSLNLSGNNPGRDGLRALLRSRHVTGLKELVLQANGLTGQAMQEFGTARPELQLEILDLSQNLLQDLGAADLAAAPCLRELKVLHLNACEMALDGARKLGRAAFLTGLRKMNLNHNSFGSQALVALLERKPASLHTLEMSANVLGDEGASYLAESPASDTLLELDLRHNGLGPQGVQSLAESRHLRSLIVLRLNYVPFCKPDLAAWQNSLLGQRVEVLDITDAEEIPF